MPSPRSKPRIMWYDDLPTQRDKANQQAYSAWLRSFPWQIYFTLTFSYQLSRACAERQSREFVNVLERHYRAPVGCLVAEEHLSWSGCGLAATRVHFHGLLCCDVHLDPEMVEAVWHRMGHFDGNAQARVYDPTRNATEYCMKFLSHPDTNWDIGHLHHFVEPKGPINQCEG